MPKQLTHQRLPSLKNIFIRRSIILGAVVAVLLIISLAETTSLSGNIYRQLNLLQQELSKTQQQFDTHLSWNNLTNQISLDTSNFLFEFELLTIDTERSDEKISALISKLRHHHEVLTVLPVDKSYLDNAEKIKRDIWTLEDIGLEFLDTVSTNARYQLYRDSIEFVEAINKNTLSINLATIEFSKTLKKRIEQVVEQSRENQRHLDYLLNSHNMIVIAISIICFAIVLVSFVLLFYRLSERIRLLEQYSIDISNQSYQRPPFSSKDITGRLATRMGLMARTIRDSVTRLKKSTKEIEELAYYDTLTGLENRRLFYKNLEQAVLLSRRYDERYALVYMDLDFFKTINDTHGHDAGDNVLVRVARRLHLVLREEDHIARLGGDEFALLLRGDSTEINHLVERILKVLQQPFQDSEFELKLSASIGITILGEDADNLSDLMRYADMALYKAKESGRNTYHYFSEQLEAKAIRKSKILKELEAAIENDELELFYQTQHNMKDKRITGVEALIRWPNPEGGYIFPDEFIPLAEENGLIIPLGEWILNQACHDGKLLNDLAGPLTISINLSTRQFDDPELLEKIIHHCQVYELPHNIIDLEITESLLLIDMDQAVKTLDSMRKKGFKISLDDFGTGYSSLFYLKNLPVTSIKIDKSFTAGIPSDEMDAAIVESTIQLAHRLNLKLVAEGIETEEQLNYLKHCNCDTAQGYLLGKPQPLEKVIERLKKGQSRTLSVVEK